MVLPNKNIFKIGYKIKAFRKANNLTQEQLADKMNCNFKTIGNLENDRTMPDLKQVINLCDVLNVSMDELFAGTLSKTENFIEPSEDDEGYQKFVIAPKPVGDLKYVKSTYETLYGTILVDWTRQSGTFTLNVSVPVNTTAIVYLPGEKEPKEVQSGTYKFVAAE